MLQHFIEAQTPVYNIILAELRDGQKETDWMWFIFPQLAGLGSSEMSQKFALAGIEEAQTYAAHPLLGARLRECSSILSSTPNRTARQILGTPDDLKLRSSLTLFLLATDEEIFRLALKKYFRSRLDARTLRLLGRGSPRARE
jgi:uncharacterized protein (DUF1810 family)